MSLWRRSIFGDPRRPIGPGGGPGGPPHASPQPPPTAGVPGDASPAISPDIRPARELPKRAVHTVSHVSRLLRDAIEGGVRPLWIQGEISNLRRPSSGHIYLTLKDDESQLKAIVYRSTAERLTFEVEDGMAVLCYGQLTYYEARGDTQIRVDAIEPAGMGAAQLALEQLKRRLLAEGLFDPARKRALPRFPGVVGLVTSATGAAVKDILQVLERRCPRLRVILAPVRVQGEGAAREVARAVRELDALSLCHVLIVGRGGGGKEDLSAFNDEGVARAIAACRAPVISAVGHEIDTTVADLVADRRAATPTEAAELATPNVAELLEALAETRDRLQKALQRGVRTARQRVEMLSRSYALREPKDRLRRLEERLDELALRLPREARRRLSLERDRLAAAAGRLEGLSPLGALARGFSVTTRVDAGGDRSREAPLRDAAGLRPGERLRTRLAEGEVISEVVEVAPSRRAVAEGDAGAGIVANSVASHGSETGTGAGTGAGGGG